MIIPNIWKNKKTFQCTSQNMSTIQKKHQPIQVASKSYHLDLHVFLRSFFSLAASDGVGSLTGAGGRGVLLLQGGKPRSVPCGG